MHYICALALLFQSLALAQQLAPTAAVVFRLEERSTLLRMHVKFRSIRQRPLATLNGRRWLHTKSDSEFVSVLPSFGEVMPRAFVTRIIKQKKKKSE